MIEIAILAAALLAFFWFGAGPMAADSSNPLPPFPSSPDDTAAVTPPEIVPTDACGDPGSPDAGCDCPAPPVSGTWPSVKLLAQAIAQAEGFGVPGALPTRAKNPGDLTRSSQPSIGVMGSENILVFPDIATGWQALYDQLTLIANGGSHVYGGTDTIATLAQKWTGGDGTSDWARNVVNWYLSHGYPGVTTATSLTELFAL